MSVQKTIKIAVATLSVFTTFVAGQSLDPNAAKYDLFIFNGPNLSTNTTYMDFKEGGFNGLMGFGRRSWNYVEPAVGFGGELRWHSELYDPSFNPTLLPGSVVNTRGAHDSELDLVNSQLLAYISALESMTSDQSFSTRSSAFSYTTTKDFTVIDVAGFNMSGSGDSITLNGRAGFNDTIVIRSTSDSIWAGGAPVTLNNLDRRNVIWLAMNESDFDLHKNAGANFEGVIINHNNSSADYSTIIGDVDFKGQVYASHIKLGTDVYFQGSSTFGPPVPEPSATLILLGVGTGLLLVRRRH